MPHRLPHSSDGEGLAAPPTIEHDIPPPAIGRRSWDEFSTGLLSSMEVGDSVLGRLRPEETIDRCTNRVRAVMRRTRRHQPERRYASARWPYSPLAAQGIRVWRVE